MFHLTISRVFLSLTFISFLAVLTHQASDQNKIYLIAVRCNGSELYFYQNFSCYAKSFNRSYSAGSLLATTIKPMNFLIVEARLYYKYGTIYREVMHGPRVDYCQMTKDNYNNGMTKQLIQLSEDSMPGFLHPCPYTEFIVRNISVKTESFLSLFPTGDYKMTFSIFDRKGNNIGSVLIIGSNNSPIKDTFG